MVANHIHDALAQVRRLRALILEKRRFSGYSGKARIGAGCVALAAAFVMGSDSMPSEPGAHLIGWGLVLAVGLLSNYGALTVWFLFNPNVRRKWVMLKPAADAVPPLAVGAILSVALILAEQFDLLFGVWMCLYGLAHTAYRHSMPVGILVVGVGYMACGAACLLWPPSFVNPWPMGLIFFTGEVAGGIVLPRRGDERNDKQSL